MSYESFVYRKTELGSNEVKAPSAHLSPKHRRCLILIDGVKTVADPMKIDGCESAGELRTVLRRGRTFPGLVTSATTTPDPYLPKPQLAPGAV